MKKAVQKKKGREKRGREGEMNLLNDVALEAAGLEELSSVLNISGGDGHLSFKKNFTKRVGKWKKKKKKRKKKKRKKTKKEQRNCRNAKRGRSEKGKPDARGWALTHHSSVSGGHKKLEEEIR
jgi:hypothetical protein